MCPRWRLRRAPWTSSSASSSTCDPSASTSTSARGGPSPSASTRRTWPRVGMQTASSRRPRTPPRPGHFRRRARDPATWPPRRRSSTAPAGRPAPTASGSATGQRLSTTIAVRPTSVDQFTFANEAAEQLAECGIELLVEELDLTGGTMLDQLLWPNDFDTLLMARPLGPDPDSAVRSFESSRITTAENQADANPSGFTSSLVDHLISAARETLDPAERAEAYAGVQDVLSDDVPYWPLWYESNVSALSTRVQGPDGPARPVQVALRLGRLELEARLRRGVAAGDHRRTSEGRSARRARPSRVHIIRLPVAPRREACACVQDAEERPQTGDLRDHRHPGDDAPHGGHALMSPGKRASSRSPPPSPSPGRPLAAPVAAQEVTADNIDDVMFGDATTSEKGTPGGQHRHRRLADPQISSTTTTSRPSTNSRSTPPRSTSSGTYRRTASTSPSRPSSIPTLANGGVRIDAEPTAECPNRREGYEDLPGFEVDLNIKPGLKWSDGETLDLNDMRYTWEWNMDPDNVGSLCRHRWLEHHRPLRRVRGRPVRDRALLHGVHRLLRHPRQAHAARALHVPDPGH